MATATIALDRPTYAPGEEITVRIIVTDLAPGQDAREEIAKLLGNVELSTGVTVQAEGEVTITHPEVPAETVKRVGLDSDLLSFKLESLEGNEAVFKGIAA